MDTPQRASFRDSLFGIIGFLLLLMLFFRADELLGTVPLRVFYSSAAGPVSVLLILAIPLFLVRWRLLDQTIGIGMGALFVGVFIISKSTLLNWGLAIVFSMCLQYLTIPAIVGFALALILWPLSAWKPNFIALRLQKVAVIGLIFVTIAYISGVGALPDNLVSVPRGQLSSGSHYYYLSLHPGDLGDPDILLLYECNPLGFFCVEAFHSSDSYVGKDISLVPTENGAAVRVNGKIITPAS